MVAGVADERPAGAERLPEEVGLVTCAHEAVLALRFPYAFANEGESTESAEIIAFDICAEFVEAFAGAAHADDVHTVVSRSDQDADILAEMDMESRQVDAAKVSVVSEC